MFNGVTLTPIQKMQLSNIVDAASPEETNNNRNGTCMRRNRYKQNRIRRFVFTLNNWTEDQLTSIKAYPCTWMIVAKETGESGTPHLQGACVIGKQVTFSSLKKYNGFHKSHIFPMGGTPLDSVIYCTKEDKDAFTKGKMPQEGKRNDIKNAVERIQNGETVRDLCKDEAGGVAVVKFFKGLTVLQSMLTTNRTTPPKVYWIHGPTDTGKTRSAIQFALLFGENGYWISGGSLRWFDQYDGQRVAIFDDLRTKHTDFSMLLRLLDRYPLHVEFKGGYVNWTPEVIIITAPKSPQSMWNLRCDEDLSQLTRRCTRIYHHQKPSGIFGKHTSNVIDIKKWYDEDNTIIKEEKKKKEDH